MIKFSCLRQRRIKYFVIAMIIMIIAGIYGYLLIDHVIFYSAGKLIADILIFMTALSAIFGALFISGYLIQRIIDISKTITRQEKELEDYYQNDLDGNI